MTSSNTNRGSAFRDPFSALKAGSELVSCYRSRKSHTPSTRHPLKSMPEAAPRAEHQSHPGKVRTLIARRCMGILRRLQRDARLLLAALARNHQRPTLPAPLKKILLASNALRRARAVGQNNVGGGLHLKDLHKSIVAHVPIPARHTRSGYSLRVVQRADKVGKKLYPRWAWRSQGE